MSKKILKGIGERGETIRVLLDSLSSLIQYEITYEQIAARWNDDLIESTLPLTGIPSSSIVKTIWEEDNTLNNGIQLDGLIAFSIDGSTEDIVNLGNQYNAVVGNKVNDHEYGCGYTPGTAFVTAKPGSQLWLSFSGDAAPTEGSISLKIDVLK